MPFKRGINKDNTPSTYGRDSVDWAIRNNILKEDERHNIHLVKDCTKQEVIQYIYSLYKMLAKQKG